MKNKKNGLFKKVVFIVTILCTLISSVAISATSVFAAERSVNNTFVGYSGSANIEATTNTDKNSDGSYTNPVSTNAPQITVLIPGFGSQASTWSNNYRTGIEIFGENGEQIFYEDLAYNSNSFLEKLRGRADATVYYAKVTTGYYEHEKDENGNPKTEGKPKNDLQSFVLYEYPDFCEHDNCSSCMFKEEYDIFKESEATAVTKITDISKHIVILFEPKEPNGSNEKIYQQLNYVIDKIVYDVKILNNDFLPRINLIGHSRGGLTAMQYALEHPYLVDSLISIGTPYLGTYLGLEFILNMLDMSADPTNKNFSFGVEDILNEDVYKSYRDTWNAGYEEKYSHINFHAIAGLTSRNGIMEILKSDPFLFDLVLSEYEISEETEHAIRVALEILDAKREISNYLSVLSLYDSELFLLGDLFIDYFSQCAFRYSGVKNYTRCFDPENMDFSMLCEANVAIPHNLEPGDAEIREYILSKIDTGSTVSYVKKTDGTYKLVRATDLLENGHLSVHSHIDGIPVTEIGNFALYDNSDITSVTIPATVTKIGTAAFFGCSSLGNVTCAEGSGLKCIDAYAFEGCTALSSFVFPDSLETIGARAFKNTGLTSVLIGRNVSTIGDDAFLHANVSSFSVSDENSVYSEFGDVLCDKDVTHICFYPTGKSSSNYTAPTTVTSISPNAFCGAENLTRVTLSNVTDIGDGAFADCTALATINAPLVSSVGIGAFANTAFLSSTGTSLKVVGDVLVGYNGNDSELTIDYASIAPFAFQNCDSLTSLTLGDKVEYIGMLAFYGAKNLTKVYIRPSEVIDADVLVFNPSTQNRKIYVSGGVYTAYRNEATWTLYKDEFSLHNTTIIFDPNGGTFELETDSIPYLGTIDIYPAPLRTGYRFGGWKCVIDGEEVVTGPLSTWYSFEDEVTFVAQWSIINYAVTLNTNGGTLASTSLTYTVNNALKLPIPTKTGYIFNGWYTNSSFTGSAVTRIPLGSTGARTYYAKWSVEQYEFSIYLNGGDHLYFPSSATVNYGQPFSFSVAGLSNEGHTFDGWSYNGVLYTDENENSVRNWDIKENVTLIAEWTREKYYAKIHVNAIDYVSVWWATSSSSNASWVHYGIAFDEDDIYEAFMQDTSRIKPGYKFMYFTEDPITPGTVPSKFDFWSEEVMELGPEHVFELNAYYVPETDFSINLTIIPPVGMVETEVITADYGEAISIYDPWVPSGYLFKGWRIVSISGNNESGFVVGEMFGDYTKMPDLSGGIEADGTVIYLETVYEAITTRIYYFDDDQYLNGLISTIPYDTMPSNNYYFRDPPSKAGYTFCGWCDLQKNLYSDGTGKLTARWNKVADICYLRAKWTPITYTITYYLDEDATHSNISSYTIEDYTIKLSGASLDGYKFIKWTFTNDPDAEAVTEIPTGSTGNKTLYAHFEKIHTVTVRNQDGSDTKYENIAGETIAFPWLHAAHIYVCVENPNIKVISEGEYIIPDSDVTFTVREKTFEECYTNGYYEIYTVNQLAGIRTVNTDHNAKVRLMQSIYFGDEDRWTPIDVWRGEFDGGNCTIFNLYINILLSDEENAVGMFCENYGTIKNLIVQDATIVIESNSTDATINAGAIAGFNRGTIDAVGVHHAIVETRASSVSLGAIVGYNEFGVVTGCVAMDVVLEGCGDMGMVVGTSNGGTINGCSVYGESATMYIRGENRTLGGIVGYAYNSCHIEYCRVLLVNFSFDDYEGIDRKQLKPCIGYIVGRLQNNATMDNVCVEEVTMTYGGLPAAFTYLFTVYNPRAYVCTAGDGTVGLNNGCTIGNTNWDGIIS